MDHLFITLYSLVAMAIIGVSLGMLLWAAKKDGEKQRRMEQNLA